MKIYTKTGDKGSTSLVSGRRVSKSAPLIEAYGTVDELNTFVGALGSDISSEDLLNDLSSIQHTLFNIGSLLAADNADFPDYPDLKEEDISHLEFRIDAFNEDLSKMTAFILPFGSHSIAQAHICRTVCRRAERRVLALENIEEYVLIVKYLNRLSDYFFVLARYLHHIEGVPEQKWDKDFRNKSR